MTALTNQDTSGIDKLAFPIAFKSDSGELWRDFRKSTVGFVASAAILLLLMIRETDAVFSNGFSFVHGLCIASLISAVYFLRKRSAVKSQINAAQDNLLTIDSEKIRDHVTFYPDTGTFAWRDITSFSYDSSDDVMTFELSSPFSIERAADDDGEPVEPTYEGVVSRQQYSMETGHLRKQVHKLRRILAELGAEER